ncbi:MAG: 3'(2'),5'-bisphosphate nucleotidase CysQ [Deltaproteobacteria bacterium]|nr:3'(2'),5'-bisphosphate nucleotidase CysQ [Deltaproteobacteria bacterium]
MLKRELQEAKRMAREAGDILMKIYATDFSVAYKGVRDPVTDADKQANSFLVAELSRLFPEDAIIAEESPELRDDGGAARCWYVDPVDGTKEFISKNGEFSVMIGLAIAHESRLGVVYQPAKDKLYSGIVGEGAWLEEAGQERALTVSEVATPSELSLVVSRSHRSESTDTFVKRVGIHKESKSGSVGLKVGLIAEQVADLYVHISDRSMKWDACGPEAILRGAGGRFTDLAGERFRYGDGPLANVGGILASNAAAFDAVLPDAREVARAEGLVD